MKLSAFNVLSVLMVLTSVEPILAQTSRTTIESTRVERLSDLGIHVNPQLGVSSFEYSKNSAGDSKSKLSGGATFEFGGAARKLETGLLILNTDSSATLKNGGEAAISSTYLTIPMLAKLRLISLGAQSWYAKAGFMPAFELSSSRNSATNNLDVLTSLGFGGRLYFNRRTDFVVEASYNRGLIDSLRNQGSSYNQGFLIMAGMSFNI